MEGGKGQRKALSLSLSEVKWNPRITERACKAESSYSKDSEGFIF